MIEFNLGQVFATTLANMFGSLHWFILVIWTVKTIAKQMPGWLNQYHTNQIKELTMKRAMELKK